MIKHQHLREYIIRPVLKSLGLYSLQAEELLVLTAAQESRLGYYLHQEGGGPALGIYQMEPATHDDIWTHYLAFNRSLGDSIRVYGSDAQSMVGNLYYATAMARAHYRRVKEGLPAADDIQGLARYWKEYFNTPSGKGTEAECIRNYRELVK